MKKNKSLRITLASLILIIFFGYSSLFFIFFFPPSGSPLSTTYKYSCYLVVSLSGLIASIFVLDFKKWARKLIIFSCSLFLGIGLFVDLVNFMAYKIPFANLNLKILGLYLFWAAVLFFLGQPNIKQQFE